MPVAEEIAAALASALDAPIRPTLTVRAGATEVADPAIISLLTRESAAPPPSIPIITDSAVAEASPPLKPIRLTVTELALISAFDASMIAASFVKSSVPSPPTSPAAYESARVSPSWIRSEMPAPTISTVMLAPVALASAAATISAEFSTELSPSPESIPMDSAFAIAELSDAENPINPTDTLVPTALALEIAVSSPLLVIVSSPAAPSIAVARASAVASENAAATPATVNATLVDAASAMLAAVTADSLVMLSSPLPA